MLVRVGVLAFAAGEVLLGAAVPGAGERLAVRELPDAVEPRPFPELGDKIFFNAVPEYVPESRDLRLLLVTDRDRLVALPPDLPRPTREPAHLPGQVRVEVAGKFRKPLRILGPDDEVIVVRQQAVEDQLDRIEPLGPAKDARGDVVELRAGPEQQASLQGPAGDLDQGASIGDVAEFSCHTPTEDVKFGCF